MQPSFWHEVWAKKETRFHGSEANPHLVAHLSQLGVAGGGRVFVPLCGKTLDIAWLLAQGYRVAGAELSELAIEQLFEELGVAPEVSRVGEMDRYSALGIDIFVGNIFDLSAETLEPVDAVYDRAALVALPAELREKYAMHLMTITSRAPQLLITYEYDQSLQEGPPFSVSGEEVARHYGEGYELTLLERSEVEGGLRGKCAAWESVWRLG